MIEIENDHRYEKLMTHFLIVALVSSLLASVMGCRGNSNHQKTPLHVQNALSWDSPRMVDIKAEASRRTPPDPPPGIKGRSTEELKTLLHVMEEQLSTGEWDQLAQSLSTMPYEPNRHAPYIVECMIRHCLNSKERERLVTLLSIYCPKELDGHQDIELEVAGIEWTEAPLLILRDAYLKSNRQETRKAIADAFRRAFVGLGITSSDDESMVLWAVKWYLENQNKIIINPDYSDNAWQMVIRLPEEEMKEYERRPLFIFKN